MSIDLAGAQPEKRSFGSLIKSMGPGIMMASACIGGSHLVASTKAGAIYGWQLVALILLVNFFKYPFFRAGIQYTMGTGETLVEGYSKLGRPYLWLFVFLTVISSVINTAALTMFSASLLSYFVPVALPISTLSLIVLLICLTILLTGHFKALDALSKVIMSVLTITTLIAVAMAAHAPAAHVAHFHELSPWTMASIGFLVITMGWMPAPIEISSITSVWLKKQKEHQDINTRSALFDFNVGYIGTALLAIVFLSLGALMLHGTGIKLQSSGMGFSHQLVSLYANTIGEWSRYLIAIIAFFAIFGSTITVIDGYSRVISESHRLLTNQKDENSKLTYGLMIVISIIALAIVLFWASALLPMLNFAMVLAFITTPFFALLNYILVTRSKLPADLQLSNKLKALSIAGLIYLFGFLIIFIWWKWFM